MEHLVCSKKTHGALLKHFFWGFEITPTIVRFVLLHEVFGYTLCTFDKLIPQIDRFKRK